MARSPRLVAIHMRSLSTRYIIKILMEKRNRILLVDQVNGFGFESALDGALKLPQNTISTVPQVVIRQQNPTKQAHGVTRESSNRQKMIKYAQHNKMRSISGISLQVWAQLYVYSRDSWLIQRSWIFHFTNTNWWSTVFLSHFLDAETCLQETAMCRPTGHE